MRTYTVTLRPDGIKLHVLHIVRGAALEKEWNEGKIRLMERDDYISLTCDILEILPPETCIQRLTAEARPQSHLAPDWILQKSSVLQDIDRELARRDTWQGKKFGG